MNHGSVKGATDISSIRRWLIVAVISISGGVVFLLPFLQEVYYTPLATALSLNNTEVGSLLSMFGFTSLVCYFPGGWLADRVSSRALITSSLTLTGALGFYFATFPSYSVSLAIHGLWGVSITLLFWGAMIRATRNSAPPKEQGRAFGMLETGRGFAEVLSSVALLAVFAALGSKDLALSAVIQLMSGFMILLGMIAWLVLTEPDETQQRREDKPKVGLEEILATLKMPIVWLIGLVVMCGYCAYWGTFRFTSYASDIFMLSVTIAASISVGKMWLKPLAALIAGFIADKFGIARSVCFLFLLLMTSFILFALLPGTASLLPVMLINVAIASIAVYAMRGIYFALLEEGGIPLSVTGTAAGIVSTIGFSPDIFMPILGGVLLDSYPGAEGYRYFFLSTAGICALGLGTATVIYIKFVKGLKS
ncbi:MAG: nitrate/nitrite transporter [Halioglobus sp.]